MSAWECPAEADVAISPVSVTVTLYDADDDVPEDLAVCPVATACVITLMLLTTGGEFCGR